MATPAESLPRITVQKLVVDRAEEPFTLDIARNGIKGFNAKCPHTITFPELLDVMRIVSDLGASDTTATFQLDDKVPNRTWSISAVKPDTTASVDDAPQAQPFQLNARQQALAEGVMVEVVGALAKHGTPGKYLNKAAINLANAFRAGLGQLQQPAPRHDQSGSAGPR
ncbi:hypothetical protein [Vreelandella sp. EE22]